MNKTVYVLGAGVNKAINTPSTAPDPDLRATYNEMYV
jgi:hypothetical protein